MAEQAQREGLLFHHLCKVKRRFRSTHLNLGRPPATQGAQVENVMEGDRGKSERVSVWGLLGKSGLADPEHLGSFTMMQEQRDNPRMSLEIYTS